MALEPLRIGTAGWSVPSRYAAEVPPGGSHLERYARRLNAVEINSSFYRPHQHKTYARWAQSTPPGFRFAVKVPKAITHESRLADCGARLDRFVAEVAGLGDKLGVCGANCRRRSSRSIAVLLRCAACTDRRRGGARAAPCKLVRAGLEAWSRRRLMRRVAADPAPVEGAGEPAVAGTAIIAGRRARPYIGLRRAAGRADASGCRAAGGGRGGVVHLRTTRAGHASGNALALRSFTQ